MKEDLFLVNESVIFFVKSQIVGFTEVAIYNGSRHDFK